MKGRFYPKLIFYPKSTQKIKNVSILELNVSRVYFGDGVFNIFKTSLRKTKNDYKRKTTF